MNQHIVTVHQLYYPLPALEVACIANFSSSISQLFPLGLYFRDPGILLSLSQGQLQF